MSNTKPRRKSESSKRPQNIAPSRFTISREEMTGFYNELYQEVGQALSTWERLQSAMISLLSTIIKASPEARQALGAPHANVGALHRMVEYAANRGLGGGEVHADVLDLNDEVLKFSQRRNDIAHAFVSSYCNGKDHDAYLQPAFTTTHAMLNHDTPEYFWNADQLRAFTQHFVRMGQDAQALDAEIARGRREEEERRRQAQEQAAP